MSSKLIWFCLLAILPISELRGAIPFGLAHGFSWLWVYLGAVLINACVCPLFWGFLNWGNQLFMRWNWYQKLFHFFVERARHKMHQAVERYGFWGIMLFVGIPLPITGAWTGTLGAWVLDLGFRRSLLAISLGVIISGLIVLSISLLGLQGLSFLIKTEV